MPRLAPRSNDAPLGEYDGLARRQDHGFLRRAVGALPGRLPQPHTLADAGPIDALADGVDHSGAVLVRHLLREADPLAAGFPVGRVDPRHAHGDPHLAGSGLGHRPVDEVQDRGVAGCGVDDCAHNGSLRTTAYAAEFSRR